MGETCQLRVVWGRIPSLHKSPIFSLPVETVIFKTNDFSIIDKVDKNFNYISGLQDYPYPQISPGCCALLSPNMHMVYIGVREEQNL